MAITPIVQGDGKTHGTPLAAKAGTPVKTLCGRIVTPDTTFVESGWPRLVTTHRRLGKTHVVHTCAACVKKS